MPLQTRLARLFNNTRMNVTGYIVYMGTTKGTPISAWSLETRHNTRAVTIKCRKLYMNSKVVNKKVFADELQACAFHAQGRQYLKIVVMHLFNAN
jgi:hypothetical protein